MTRPGFCAKYFNVLNSSRVSFTGSPLRLASMDEKLTFTSPNTSSLSSPLALDGIERFSIKSRTDVLEVSTSELFPVVFTESLLLYVAHSGTRTMTAANCDCFHHISLGSIIRID